jgi:hypothetical protein
MMPIVSLVTGSIVSAPTSKIEEPDILRDRDGMQDRFADAHHIPCLIEHNDTVVVRVCNVQKLIFSVHDRPGFVEDTRPGGLFNIGRIPKIRFDFHGRERSDIDLLLAAGRYNADT